MNESTNGLSYLEFTEKADTLRRTVYEDGAKENIFPIFIFRHNYFLNAIAEGVKERIPNTVILNWSKEAEVNEEYAEKIKRSFRWMNTLKRTYSDETTKSLTEMRGRGIFYLDNSGKSRFGLSEMKKIFFKIAEKMNTIGCKKMYVYLPFLCDHGLFYGDGDNDFFYKNNNRRTPDEEKKIKEIFANLSQEIGIEIETYTDDYVLRRDKKDIEHSCVVLDRHAWRSTPFVCEKAQLLVVKNEFNFFGYMKPGETIEYYTSFQDIIFTDEGMTEKVKELVNQDW